jgi:hypothetical protein
MGRFLRNGFGHGLCPTLPRDNDTGGMVFHRQARIVLGGLDCPNVLACSIPGQETAHSGSSTMRFLHSAL